MLLAYLRLLVTLRLFVHEEERVPGPRGCRPLVDIAPFRHAGRPIEFKFEKKCTPVVRLSHERRCENKRGIEPHCMNVLSSPPPAQEFTDLRRRGNVAVVSFTRGRGLAPSLLSVRRPRASFGRTAQEPRRYFVYTMCGSARWVERLRGYPGYQVISAAPPRLIFISGVFSDRGDEKETSPPRFHHC